MKAKKWVLWVIIGTTALCLLPCGFGIIAFKLSPYGQGEQIVKDDQAKAKKLGLLTSLTEVPRWVEPVEDNENSAPLYKAFAVDRKPFAETITALEKVKSFGHGREIEWESIGNCLKTLGPLVKQAHIIASKKGFNANRDWSKGFMILFPEFAQMKTITRLLAWEAVVKAHLGDRPGAIRGLTAALSISKQARAEPTIIGLLVHEALETILWNALQEVLANGSITSADRRELGTYVERMALDPDQARFMWVEHLFSDQVLLSNQGPPSSEMTNEERSAQRLMKYPPIRSAMRSILWETALKTQSVLTQKGKTALQRILEIDSEDKKLAVRRDIASTYARLFNFESRKRILLTQLRRQVRRDLLTAIAKGEEGAIKAKDPFSDMPYLTKRNGKEFEIYSVGINLTDDGGILYIDSTDSKVRAQIDLGMRFIEK